MAGVKGPRVNFVSVDEITWEAPQVIADEIRRRPIVCNHIRYFDDVGPARCIMKPGHSGDHQSSVYRWPADPADPAGPPSAEELAQYDAALGWEPE